MLYILEIDSELPRAKVVLPVLVIRRERNDRSGRSSKERKKDWISSPVVYLLFVIHFHEIATAAIIEVIMRQVKILREQFDDRENKRRDKTKTKRI